MVDISNLYQIHIILIDNQHCIILLAILYVQIINIIKSGSEHFDFKL